MTSAWPMSLIRRHAASLARKQRHRGLFRRFLRVECTHTPSTIRLAQRRRSKNMATFYNILMRYETLRPAYLNVGLVRTAASAFRRQPRHVTCALRRVANVGANVDAGSTSRGRAPAAVTTVGGGMEMGWSIARPVAMREWLDARQRGHMKSDNRCQARS